MFLTNLWYAFNKLTLEGVAIFSFLEIRLLAESKSAEFLISALINSLIAFSNFVSMKEKYAQYLINKTKDDYNLIADDFSRTRGRAWEEISFLFQNIKDNEKILDLGCGNGRICQFLENNKVDYIGVDNSEKLIGIAQKKYPDKKFLAVDALNLLFADNYFNRIYSIAVLHHIPSKKLRRRFLEEAGRILKPGGKLIITVWKFHNFKERRLLLKYTILKIIGRSDLDFKDILEPWADKAERYYHWFSTRELKKIFQRAGFKIKKIGIVKNERGNRRNIYLIAEKDGLASS